ncbi:unnamed protein product [Sympodiomycopsis kandeliae]
MASIGGSSKRKQPLTVNAGFTMTEQAGQAGGASSSSKRPRYTNSNQRGDQQEELFEGENLDFTEQDRKRNQQGRKGRVVTDGYDSEDDDDEEEEKEGEDGIPGKVAGIDADGDEDDDMFDVEEKKDKQPQQKKRKGDYLALNEIEGQEFKTGQNGALSDESDIGEERDPELELESDSDDHDENEDDKEQDAAAAGEKTPPLSPGGTTVVPRKKGKKPVTSKEELFSDMGFKLDGFNMKNEMEAGRFDNEGNYIANAKDPHQEHDKWLTGTYNKKSIRAAREAQKKREAQEAEKSKDQSDVLQHQSQVELLKQTAEAMQTGESVLETLQRLGNEANKHRPKSNKNTSRRNKIGKDDQMQTDAVAAQLPHESVAVFESFTALTSTLMTKFNRYNLYDEEYHSILREVRRSGTVAPDWDPVEERKKSLADLLDDDDEDKPSGDTQFVYQWSPSYLAEMGTADKPQETFGPFPLSDLEAWKEAGYFGSQSSAERIVLKRYVQGGTDEGRDWKSWTEVLPRH